MSNQKVLLHLGTPEDEPYQARLAGLTSGSQVAWKSRLKNPDTVVEIEILSKNAKVDGIVCSNGVFLTKLLHAQPDFIPPNNRRGITLDDYQGSLMFTPRENIPVVIVNPLANLVSVDYATFAARRFISKLTRPGDWFTQTKFTWEIAEANTIADIFERWLAESAYIAIDTETPNPPTPQRTINCVGYCAYFPKTGTTECLVIPFTSMFWVTWVRKFNMLPQPKVMQNGLYDCVYFLRWSCPVFNWLFDTQHLFHSWFSGLPKRLDFITAFALRHIRYWKDDGKTGSLEDYYRYCAKDCWATLNSFLALMAVADDFALRNYLKEFPLVFPCITCELEGFEADQEQLAIVKAKKEQEILVKQKSLETMIATPGFNVNSPVQVKKLFHVLGLKHLPDTSKPSMLKAQASHPLNNRILTTLVDIRKARKVVSVYLQSDKLFFGRWTYKLNPAGTDSGRLASTESSFWSGLQIQNIPPGDDVKSTFCADKGWYLCEIDKSQSEARCVAYMSGEEKLIDAVEGPNDFHAWNAQAFFGLPYETIYDNNTKTTSNKEIRDLSKRTNHGANYNMGDQVMLDTMGPKNVSRAKILLKLSANMSLKNVCGFLLRRYETTYPKVKGLFYDHVITEIERTGKLVSPRGWTRVFFSKPSRANKPALNAAVAHGPQNLSVDIVNEEFYNIWRVSIYGNYYKTIGGELIDTEKTRACRNNIRMKAQIHDSNLFQYRTHMWIPQFVRDELMNTSVDVKGADGITRTMTIPSDVSIGKKNKETGEIKLATRWSELK